MAKRSAYKKEPKLHVHRYVVVIYKNKKATYRYAMNLKDVKEYRDQAPKGSVIEVYKAIHEFKEVWVK